MAGVPARPMRFRIDYRNPRKQAREVSARRFVGSSAFYPVLQLAVGESIGEGGRYASAGYARITRIA